MTDTSKQLREHKHCCERIYYAMAKGQDALAVKVLQDELAKAREEEKQLSYNEGVEDARLAVCSVEKNTWEKYVYLRIDKIFELLKKLTNKD